MVGVLLASVSREAVQRLSSGPVSVVGWMGARSLLRFGCCVLFWIAILACIDANHDGARLGDRVMGGGLVGMSACFACLLLLLLMAVVFRGRASARVCLR